MAPGWWLTARVARRKPSVLIWLFAAARRRRSAAQTRANPFSLHEQERVAGLSLKSDPTAHAASQPKNFRIFLFPPTRPVRSSHRQDIPKWHEFKDIIGNKEAISRLEVFSREGNLPNIILSGPPGCGKTTTMLCLARKILGDQMKDAVLELNASNDRGLEVVRNKIKMFAQTKVTLPAGKQKLIILDEADSMTEGAQQALRRIIELYSKTTRFAFACNTFDKMIEPIQSRCAVVRFTRIPDNEIRSKIIEICKMMGVKYDGSGIDALLHTAQGDMRQAINNLQSTYDGFGEVTSDNVFKVCDEPPPIMIKDIINHCLQGKLREAEESLVLLYKRGYCSEDLISSIFRVVKAYKTEEGMTERVKLDYLKSVGTCHIRIVQGVNSLLQLKSLIVSLCQKGQNYNSSK
ncbi:Replication factor C subunit 2 [Fragariocoptes setiger]|uniref:Replication factor C subunit 2 n=1 Tax=Fragariocoptes setiger TaxID=1670756 RepID=A0ABQ7SBQ3_9ACAR|nr:Replication factor C subunit 2 [Fragariocoptes setiger]